MTDQHLTRRDALALGTVGVFTALAAPRAADACMPGLWHPRQDAVIYWNDGVQVLVWRTLVSRTPPPGVPTPTAPANNPAPRGPTPMAWLLAVPGAPIAYEVAEVAAFERTLGWVRSHAMVAGGRGGPPGSGGGDGIGGLQVGPTQRVGEYDVTPIRGTGPAAATELAAWLRANHFPPANAAAVQAYAQANATFLAVRARVPPNASRAELRPLAIAFRAPTIVVPVRLSAGEPPFALDVAVFSGRVMTPPTAGSAGFVASQLRVPGAPIGAPPAYGPVVIVPYVSLPDVARQLVTRVARRVPQLAPLLTGSVAMSLLSASPLTVNAADPDPSFALRDPVAPNAPGRAITG